MDAFLSSLDFAGIQRLIFSEIRGTIIELSANRDWAAFLLVLPMGIVFGAVHAVMPGHGKAMLGTYVVGSTANMGKALLVAFALAATHVVSAMLIALLAIPLVSALPWSAGRAPLLEMLSCALLGSIGCWMLVRGATRRNEPGQTKRHVLTGLFAGLIPCPLTLFTVTYCVSRGVPIAGVMFAVAMLAGILVTLSLVAAAAVAGRTVLVRLMSAYPGGLHTGSVILEAASGAVLIALAIALFPPDALSLL